MKLKHINKLINLYITIPTDITDDISLERMFSIDVDNELCIIEQYVGWYYAYHK